jgi:ribosomal protein S18 acetylase RimI-like enzyme
MINTALDTYTSSRRALQSYQTKVAQKSLTVLPATHFSIEELTDGYNQTRVDYIIPMPMTAARLQEYIDCYDIDLTASYVALDTPSRAMLGLGMLGVRDGRSWVTRLGVLPASRGRGVGQIIMERLVLESNRRQFPHVWLEVIKGNTPAHTLFQKMGFVETRELIVARRAPAPVTAANDLAPQATVRDLTAEEITAKLAARPGRPNWLNEKETYTHVPQLKGLSLQWADGSAGWVVYEDARLQMKRITLGVEAGDALEVGTAVLHQLHKSNPIKDAIYENIAEHDPLWPAYEAVGYFDSFRRVEMLRQVGIDRVQS